MLHRALFLHAFKAKVLAYSIPNDENLNWQRSCFLAGDKPVAVTHVPASSYPNKMLALYKESLRSIIQSVNQAFIELNTVSA
jgi:hypothetical protein